MSEIKTFTLYRKKDEGRVSGTGRILDGVIFHNGWVAVCWRTDIDAARHGHSSLAFYESWKAFEFIHIRSHPENASILVFGSDAALHDRLATALRSSENP